MSTGTTGTGSAWPPWGATGGEEDRPSRRFTDGRPNREKNDPAENRSALAALQDVAADQDRILAPWSIWPVSIRQDGGTASTRLIEFEEDIKWHREHANDNGNAAGQQKRKWPTLAPDALYGLPGEVVALYEPHTESDPVALLILFLVYFGNALGRGLYWQIEDTKHFTNLYSVLVGDTSEGRKGTAADRVRQFMAGVDDGLEQTVRQGRIVVGRGPDLGNPRRSHQARQGRQSTSSSIRASKTSECWSTSASSHAR